MASFASASSSSSSLRTPTRPPNPAASRSGLAAGDIVGGKYLLVRRRAVGARSVVWEAEHLKLQRRCALKVFDTNGNARIPRAAEVRATAALDHPSIPRMHDVFAEHHRDIYVFAMPLLAGDVLDRVVVVYGRFGVPRIALLLMQLVDGLVHALSRGVTFPSASTRQLFVVPPSGGEPESVKLLGFGRPIPLELACADALHERDVVRTVFTILRECIAAMPAAVDRIFEGQEAPPSIAETRRILTTLTIDRKVRE